MALSPLRPLAWLLRKVSTHAAADAAIGDILEELGDRQAAGRAPLLPAVWVNLQILRAIALETLAGLKREGWRSLELRRDVRYAIRSLRRAPWYTASVISVIGFSMALAATVFAVVDGVLFRPLPYPNAEEIFVLSGTFDNEPTSPEQLVRHVSPREVTAWNTFVPDVPMTVLSSAAVPLPDGTSALAMSVDQRFGEVFGVRLLMGSWFDDAHYNAPYQPSASPQPIIISHAVWLEQFGRDPSIVGHAYSPYTTAADPAWLPPPVFRIVGVLDRDGFVPPQPGRPENWLQRDNRVDVLYPQEAGIERERVGIAYGRVPPNRVGATEAALQSAVAAYRITASANSAPYDGVLIQSLATLLTARQRPILSLVFATTLGLTLIVLLNTGALAATRAQRRLAEFVLRRSLGARTTDLLRAALVEQALLMGAGVTLGLAVAPWLVEVVALQLPPGLRFIEAPHVDWRAAGFAGAVSTTMAVVIAALSTRYTAHHAALASAMAGRHGRSPRQAHVGRWLVAGQIAVAFALVLGGGMFVTSLGLVWQEDPGLRSRHAAMLTLSLGELARVDRENEVAAALRSIPGVSAAGAMDGSLLDNRSRGSWTFRGPAGQRPEEPVPALVRVGPGWLAATEIQLLQGRLPTDAELERGAPVIAVSEALARRYWPAGNAVGQSLLAARQEYAVVGIVRDIRVAALDVASNGMLIAPLKVLRPGRTLGATVFLALDARRPPTLTEVVSHLARVAPGVRVRTFQLIEHALADSIRPRRISAMAASTFAIGAIVLVAIGVFGVVAQTVGWRTREMGVRLALGDVPAGIVRRILVEPIRAVAVGLVGGGIVAALAARSAGSYLYGIEPHDVRLWAATTVVLLATAAVGALVPAVKAGRVDPITVLRQD
jgi:putative ABC transport system permease protein